jgi:hypothetical protein
MWRSSPAYIATLGFAISLMTPARVSLADCFWVLLFRTKAMISEIREVFWSIWVGRVSKKPDGRGEVGWVPL